MPKRLVSLIALIGLVVVAGGVWWWQGRSHPPAVDAAASAAQKPGSGAPQGAPQGGSTQGAAGAKDPKAAPGGAPGMGPAPVQVFRVKPGNVEEDLQAVGSLRSNESVMLRPEVTGRIATIGFRDGQPVRRGQLLIGLDATVNEAEVAQARAELDLASSNLRRTEDLARQNFVSGSARDQAASAAAVQEAKLKLAQTRLSKMRLLAPFDGVVGIRNVSVGDYVKEGTDLVNIEDISTLKADFRMPERLLTQLKVGQKIEVMVDALPDERFAGSIASINPRIDAAGRSIELRARLVNPGDRLRPGMFVRVRVIVGERSAALVIPEQAIVPSGNDFFVFRAVEGKAQRVQVETGVRRDGQVEIVRGLNAGDEIVVSGQQRLARDGQPIRVVPAGTQPEGSGAAAGGKP